MENAPRELSRRIDAALMELDYQFCQRAAREGLPRDQVAQVDLPSATFAALLTALGHDEQLWAEFSWEVGAPREAAFERLYQRAQRAGRCQAEPPESLPRQQAQDACDPNGLAQRIRALSGHLQPDGLTVLAVAYVLGRKPTLWRAVQAAIGQR